MRHKYYGTWIQIYFNTNRTTRDTNFQYWNPNAFFNIEFLRLEIAQQIKASFDSFDSFSELILKTIIGADDSRQSLNGLSLSLFLSLDSLFLSHTRTTTLCVTHFMAKLDPNKSFLWEKRITKSEAKIIYFFIFFAQKKKFVTHENSTDSRVRENTFVLGKSMRWETLW